MGKAKREHKARVIAGLEPPIRHEKHLSNHAIRRLAMEMMRPATMTRDEILASRRPISKREVV